MSSKKKRNDMRGIPSVLLIAFLLVGCKQPTKVPDITLGPPHYQTIQSIEVHPNVASEMDRSALCALRPTFSAIRVDYVPAWGDGLFDTLVRDASACNLRILFITPYIGMGQSPNAAAYAAVVGRGAGRYAGHSIIWELMNEPDCSIGHVGPICEPLQEAAISTAQYIDIVRATVPAIRSADPGATIISGGTSGVDLGWINAVSPIYPLVDGIAVHPYGQDPQKFAQIAVGLERVYGKPIYYTERETPAGASNVNGYTPLYNQFRP